MSYIHTYIRTYVHVYIRTHVHTSMAYYYFEYEKKKITRKRETLNILRQGRKDGRKDGMVFATSIRVGGERQRRKISKVRDGPSNVQVFSACPSYPLLSISSSPLVRSVFSDTVEFNFNTRASQSCMQGIESEWVSGRQQGGMRDCKWVDVNIKVPQALSWRPRRAASSPTTCPHPENCVSLRRRRFTLQSPFLTSLQPAPVGLTRTQRIHSASRII